MPGHVEDGLAFLRRFFVLTDVLKLVGCYYTYSQYETSEILRPGRWKRGGDHVSVVM
jgi:hypothetical protein